MVKFVKGALLTATVSLALGGIASASGSLTPAEFKCQKSVSKAGSKFVGSKSKCASKCITNAGKSLNPYSDCFAPYGGATALCINDVSLHKGAEPKFSDAIRKACDSTFKIGSTADCPECYSGGDCTQEAIDRVANIEGQVDSFGPGVFCEQPGADAAETSCELNTAKTLSKLVGSVNKCYDKCNDGIQKALIAPGQCDPPAGDPVASACISAADAKAIAGVNKKCRTVGESTPGANDGTLAVPDCSGTDDYPDGASWVNLVDVAISGNVPGTYCPSPSGAFLD
jgi:hypothetical protein